MDKEQLGNLLRFLRKRESLSQKELADNLYTSASTVCKWEKGSFAPTSDMMLRIAEFYNIPVEDLYFPEKALERLSNTSLQETEKVMAPSDETQKQLLPDPTQKVTNEKAWRGWKSFHWRKFAVTVIVIFIVLVSGRHVHAYINEPHILYSTENYTDDLNYGAIYEIDYVITVEPTHDWIQDYIDSEVVAHVRQKELDTGVVKLVFYDNRKSLENRNEEGVLADVYVFIDLY